MLHKDSSPKLIKTPLMEKKNGEKKNVVDLSPFFLFEAAGDSEGDFDHHQTMIVMGLYDLDNEDEDAQSCSYDVWDATSRVNEVNDVYRGRYRTTIESIDDDDDKFVKDSMEDKHSKVAYSREDYKSTSEVISTANSHNSRKSCVDSSEGKKMSEKERSRLFWETCLAS